MEIPTIICNRCTKRFFLGNNEFCCLKCNKIKCPYCSYIEIEKSENTICSLKKIIRKLKYKLYPNNK
jgi:hypothetical protein